MATGLGSTVLSTATAILIDLGSSPSPSDNLIVYNVPDEMEDDGGNEPLRGVYSTLCGCNVQ